MSKCSRPRASNSGVTARGNASESFGMASASCSMLPRATVPSTSARSDRPSPKKSVGESGRCFGWRAMSCWQPARPHPKQSASEAQRIHRPRNVAEALNILHLADIMRLQAHKKFFRAGAVELRVFRFDAQEEPVVRSQRKPRHIEDRMMRHGQLIERQHSKHSKDRGAEHGELERDRNEHGPAIERAAADVLGIADCGHPVLHEEAARAAKQSADQRDERHTRAAESERLGEPFHGKWRVGIHVAVAFGAAPLRSRDKLLGRVELRHQPVEVRAALDHFFSSPPVCATSSRISAIEITGRKRMNRNSSATKSPIVPASMVQSQIRGMYMPQAEGMKSRCRLTTTITNRSSHMPTFTTRDITNSAGTFVRTFRNHKSCGARMLQAISAQYRTRYGPPRRFRERKTS